MRAGMNNRRMAALALVAVCGFAGACIGRERDCARGVTTPEAVGSGQAVVVAGGTGLKTTTGCSMGLGGGTSPAGGHVGPFGVSLLAVREKVSRPG
jgi:hypothetical protein